MNKFEDMLHALRRRGDADDKLRQILPELDAVESVIGADKPPVTLRLPYSSNPRPLEEAWASN